MEETNELLSFIRSKDAVQEEEATAQMNGKRVDAEEPSPKGASPLTKSQSTSVLQTIPNYYSPIDMQVRRAIKHLQSQVDGLKKKYQKENSRRLDSEKVRLKLEEDLTDLRTNFIMKLEKVEKELVKYRREFTEIERRNDSLEALSNEFENVLDKAYENAAESVSKFRVRFAAVRCLRAWHGWYLDEKRIRGRLHKFQYRMKYSVMKRSFACWKEYVAQQAVQAINKLRAATFWTKSTLNKCFKTWVQFRDNQKKAKTILRKILLPTRHETLYSVFQAWKKMVGTNQIQRLENQSARFKNEVAVLRERFGRAILKRKIIRICRNIITSWRDYATSKSSIKRKVKVFHNRHNSRVMEESFGRWIKFVQLMKVKKKKIRQADDHARKDTLRKAFYGWRNASKLEKYSKLTGKWDTLKTSYQSLIDELESAVSIHNDSVLSRAWTQWRLYVSYRRRRKVLKKKVVSMWRTNSMSAMFSAWKTYVNMQREKKEKWKKAEDMSRRKTLLSSFRQWQEYVYSRKKTRLVSQKMSLDIHLKTIIGACDTWAIQMEDNFRDSEDELSEMRLRHEEQKGENDRLLSLIETLKNDMDELQGMQDAERDKWENRMKRQYQDFKRAIDVEKRAKEDILKVKYFIEHEIAELKDNRGGEVDRFTLKKNFEKKFNDIKDMLEASVKMRDESHRRFARNMNLLIRTLSPQNRPEDVMSMRSFYDEATSVAGSVFGVTAEELENLKAKIDEEFNHMLSIAKEGTAKTDTHQQHELDDVSKRKEMFKKSKEEVLKIKEELEQDQKDFDIMMKSVIGEKKKKEATQEEPGKKEVKKVAPEEEEEDPGKKLEKIIADAKKFVDEEFNQQKKKKSRVKFAIPGGDEPPASPSSPGSKSEKQKSSLITKPRESEGKKSPPPADEKETEAKKTKTKADEKKSFPPLPELPQIPERKPKVGKSADTDSLPKSGEKITKESLLSGLDLPQQKPKAGNPATLSLSPEALAHAKAVQSQRRSGGGRSASMMVKPVSTEMEDQSNKQLEFEIFRLKARFDKQEEHLKKKFEDQIEMWRRRYEQTMGMLLKADEWKKRFESRMQEREETFRKQTTDRIEHLEEDLEKQHQLSFFWREQFKRAEERLTETEAIRRHEKDKWQTLVSYYEDAFQVVSLNSVTELGRYKRKQAAKSPDARALRTSDEALRSVESADEGEDLTGFGLLLPEEIERQEFGLSPTSSGGNGEQAKAFPTEKSNENQPATENA